MNALFTWIFKIVLAAAALIFAVSLLLALVVVLLVTSLWALLHGRKPKVAVVWTRYRDLTRGMARRGAWSAAKPKARAASSANDIVDVQVKEVHEAPPRLPPRD